MSLRSAALAVLISTAWTGTTPADAQPGRGPVAVKPYEEPAAVELVTMGIGALIWERHGHIALCLRYRNPIKDTCYNYGIADFHKPLSMAWGFFRGTRSFWVGKQRPDQMLAIYEHGDRTIWSQVLPLNAEQKRQVYDKLEHDVLDENRYYAYDHFDDNCTTRVRDIIDDATGGALRSMTEPTDGKTFRDLARDGFFGMRIPLLITDLAMGRSTDRVPSYWERMFLPQYLREAVHKRWNLEPHVMYQRKGAPPLDDGPSGRVLFALVILLLTAPAWATRLWGRFQRTGLAVAVVPYVILGGVLWFLALISPLPYVRWNETCLILLPADVLLLGFLTPERRRRYARFRVGMLGVLAVLEIVGLVKAPLLAPILWPLIPCLVVGFWPPKAAKVAEVAKPAAETGAETSAAPAVAAPAAAAAGKLSRSIPPTKKHKPAGGGGGKQRKGR